MVPIVIVAAREATIAQSLSTKSKMAMPLLHPSLILFMAEAATTGVVTGAAFPLPSVLDSGTLMAVDVDDIFGMVLICF